MLSLVGYRLSLEAERNGSGKLDRRNPSAADLYGKKPLCPQNQAGSWMVDNPETIQKRGSRKCRLSGEIGASGCHPCR
jgi:hypothetical protein